MMSDSFHNDFHIKYMSNAWKEGQVFKIKLLWY